MGPGRGLATAVILGLNARPGLGAGGGSAGTGQVGVVSASPLGSRISMQRRFWGQPVSRVCGDCGGVASCAGLRAPGDTQPGLGAVLCLPVAHGALGGLSPVPPPPLTSCASCHVAGRHLCSRGPLGGRGAPTFLGCCGNPPHTGISRDSSRESSPAGPQEPTQPRHQSQGLFASAHSPDIVVELPMFQGWV